MPPAPDPAAAATGAPSAAYWNRVLAPYKVPEWGRALYQLGTTAALFVAGWYLMYISLDVSYWLTLALAFPVAGLVTRLFIFQHDCGHGSFFPSRRWNHVVGFVLGVVTFTPYQYWRRTHSIHHATSGNLDRRDLGDVETLTVAEYHSRGFWGRLGYRLYRNLFVLLVVAPTFQFGLKHRFPYDIPFSWKKEWRSVWLTNAALAGVVVLFHFTLGLEALLLVHGPIFLVTGALGVWLFYVQHQFEDTYWENQPEWDFHRAGIEGSSFLDLPPLLHWFTGNIGYHHIHHLSSRIPNYSLPRCMREVPELQKVTRLKTLETLRCARLKLWDETQKKLVGFREARRLAAERMEGSRSPA